MKFYFLIEIRDKKLKKKNCLWKDSVDNRQRYLYIVVNSQAIFLFSGHAYGLEDFKPWIYTKGITHENFTFGDFIVIRQKNTTSV